MAETNHHIALPMSETERLQQELTTLTMSDANDYSPSTPEEKTASRTVPEVVIVMFKNHWSKPIFASKPLRRLRPQLHPKEAIAKWIIANMERPKDTSSNNDLSSAMTKIQERGMGRRFSSVPNDFWNATSHAGLSNWFDLFDDLYLDGLLKPYCVLEILSPEAIHQRYEYGGSLWGHYSTEYPEDQRDPREPRSKYPRATIAIAKPTGSNLGDRHQLQSMTSTLLHEMVHAVMDIYESQWGFAPGGYDEDCGHNIHWQAIAQAIERINKPGSGYVTESSLNFGLGRVEGHVDDITTDRAAVFPEVILRALGLDIVEVLKLRDSQRKENNVDGGHWEVGLKPAKPLVSNCIRNEWIVDG